jgi:O-antigen/teichoic acid export membrane protein
MRGITPDARRRTWASRLRPSRTIGQGAVSALSEAAVGGLAAVSTALVARSMSNAEFGSLAFAQAFLLFSALFFDFGLLLPAARQAATADQKSKRAVAGAALIAFAPIGLLFSITVFGLSFFVDSWFNVDASEALRVVAVLAFVYPFQLLGNYVAQGLDRLHVYSVSALLAQVLYLVAIVGALVTGRDLDISLVLAMRVVSMLVAWVILIVWISPQFRSVGARLRSLATDARDFGFQVYVGRVLSIATYNMDVLMLGALADSQSVGYYALAGSLAYAVGLPVSGMAAALFPRMATAAEIPRRWLTLSWLSAAGMAAIVIAASYPLIPLVFGDRYEPAVALVLPLALAAAVRAVTTVYNSYLAAKAHGRELRNAALVLTGSNVIFNFLLIPPFGAKGAAWASFAALVLNYLAHVVSYRRSLSPGTPDEPASSTSGGH